MIVPIVTECKQGWVLLDGQCVKAEEVARIVRECPAGHFSSEGACQPCHYTCRKCTGPNDYECSQCYPDAVVYSGTGENFCFPKSLLPSVNYTAWLYRVYLGLVLNGLFLVTAGVIIFIRERGCRLKSPKKPVTAKVLERMRYKLTADHSDSDNWRHQHKNWPKHIMLRTTKLKMPSV